MITKYQLKLADATWIDVSSTFTMDNLPDRLPDALAITHSSLYNLLNCVPGERARIFQPLYGSQWKQFLQEPIMDLTAKKMEISMLQSIEKWVPQILLDRTQSRVVPDFNLPGYQVRISFSTPFSIDKQEILFKVIV